jgi:hypothetical protein
MSAPFLPEALRLAVKGPGRGYRGFPAFGSPRWLIPEAVPARHTGHRLYTPQRAGGHLLRLCMRRGWFGRRLALDEDALGQLEQRIAAALGEDCVHLSIYTGKAGANRKATMLVTARRGDVLSFAKVAASGRARAALAAERATLERLAGVPALAGQVPAVMAALTIGRSDVLCLSPGPDRPAPRRFDPGHERFLETLRSAFGEQRDLAASATWRRVTAGLSDHRSRLPARWRMRYADAHRRAVAAFGDDPVGLTFAHGDFTPWNARRSSDGAPFVFDWESASERDLPYRDRFHFFFMTSLLLGGGVRVAALRRLLRGLEVGPRAASGHFLVFLVDLGLTYHELLFARGGQGEDAVLRQVARLLDARQDWWW